MLRAFGHLPLPGIHGVLRRVHDALRVSRAIEFETGFCGLRYRGRLDDLIDWNVFFFGSYCANELDFLATAARLLGGRAGGVTYVDVGANVGHHALFMSQHAAEVLAFEPSPEACRRFAANIRLNKLSSVRLFPVALAERDGDGQLGSGFALNSGSRSLCWSIDASRNETVALRRGDDFFRCRGLPRIDLLKLDVEGYEKRVLCGLHDTLRRDRPIILMELIGTAEKGGFRDEAELRACLYPDHQLYTLGGIARAGLAPFDWRSEAAVCLPRERCRTFESRLLVRAGRRGGEAPAAGLRSGSDGMRVRMW